MKESTEQRKCPDCGKSNLITGKMGVSKHTFIPQGRIMMLGYPVKAFVCLDCGFQGNYLEEASLSDLRRRRVDPQ
ncbi:hypothetical protein [Desulfonatronovibrio magnus]|uniref:hypothetical protein n=1 Tax=Desulfonatronovibrio magnus TaxID=698827 RepID=UPI0005EB2E32|nr:hypothetical protein [Desulfonatronovibrio magnus]RQD66633.1 MAG: hypothetical protein D5R98_02080 [Desulfonatronovibrio sp. MSAO_Bac4]